MRKVIIGIIITSIVLILLFYGLVAVIVSKATDVVIKEKAQIESYVGKKYVYENDTVLVVNYSLTEQTLIFSNKKVVSSKFLETQKELK